MNDQAPSMELIQLNVPDCLKTLPVGYNIESVIRLYNTFARIQKLAGVDEFKASMTDVARSACMSIPTMEKYQKLLEARGLVLHTENRHFRLTNLVKLNERDYISEGDIKRSAGTLLPFNYRKSLKRGNAVKSTLRDDAKRELVARGLQSTGQGQPFRLVTVAMRKTTMAMREGATREDLLLILDWAERERKVSRFTGLRDLTWLWGSRWSTHLACAKGNRTDITGNDSDLSQSLRRGGKQWGT